MKHTTSIVREFTLDGSDVMDKIPIEITFTYHRLRRGHRDSLCGIRGAGPPLEPDEPAHLEIEGATDLDTGNDITLTTAETDQITDEIMEKLHENEND